MTRRAGRGESPPIAGEGGGGDPSSHEPDKAHSRSAFNGLAQAIVQTTHEAGTIKLTAHAEGFAPAELVLVSRPAKE